MTTLTELDNPNALPAGERHITCSGPTCLDEALRGLKDQHLERFVNLERVYFTRSDGRYWFTLAPSAEKKR